MFHKKGLTFFLLSVIAVFGFGWLNTASHNHHLLWNSSIPFDRAIAQSATKTPSLELPVNCDLGRDCFIMHYVDLDPSETAVDFDCGRQTYDGHKGTDFAIDNLQVMARGIPVIAAASGRVLRIRDGIQDRLVETPSQQQAVAGEECGNGVVIDLGEGWETQYCHLREGSVVVKPNTDVRQRDVLGMAGASGLASFPHVYFSIRYQGEIVDPFVGISETSGCNQELNPLWSQTLAYTPTGSIDAGFSTSPPSQTQLWQGLAKNEPLTTSSPALIFWVHSYGILENDREKWQLIAPDGTVAVERENVIERPFRSWLSYVGKRNLTSGLWRGEYQLWRNGSLIFQADREVVVEE